jgi:hypothetical protein
MADAVTEGRYIRQNRPVISKQSSAPPNRAALIDEVTVTDAAPEAPDAVLSDAPETPDDEVLSDVAPAVSPDDAPELVIESTNKPEAVVPEAPPATSDEAVDAEATESDETTTIA